MFFWEGGRERDCCAGGCPGALALPCLSPNLQLLDAPLMLELQPYPPQSTVTTLCAQAHAFPGLSSGGSQEFTAVA